jgi:putative membrane protein
MNLLSQIFASATAAALIGVGILEIFFHGDRRFYSLFLIEPQDVRAVRMWAMNIGAYNISFALGIVAGLWMVNFANQDAGAAIVIFCCAAQVALGIWLWITERRLLGSAIGQASLPAIAVVCYLFLG